MEMRFDCRIEKIETSYTAENVILAADRKENLEDNKLTSFI